jgi:hypothetical protein
MARYSQCIYLAKQPFSKPNFQVPYLHSEHSYRPGSPSPDHRPAMQVPRRRYLSFMFPFLLCQIHAKVPCVWSSQPFTLPIETKIPLPDISNRLMTRLSNGLGEPRSARRLSRGHGHRRQCARGAGGFFNSYQAADRRLYCRSKNRTAIVMDKRDGGNRLPVH